MKRIALLAALLLLAACTLPEQPTATLAPTHAATLTVPAPTPTQETQDIPVNPNFELDGPYSTKVYGDDPVRYVEVPSAWTYKPQDPDALQPNGFCSNDNGCEWAINDIPGEAFYSQFLVLQQHQRYLLRATYCVDVNYRDEDREYQSADLRVVMRIHNSDGGVTTNLPANNVPTDAGCFEALQVVESSSPIPSVEIWFGLDWVNGFGDGSAFTWKTLEVRELPPDYGEPVPFTAIE